MTVRLTRSSRSSRTEVWVLITANVVIALGYGVVSPVLPQYARNFGVSISAATFVITAFSLMRLVFAPASGLFVQKMGERRVYLSGLLIVAVSTGACAFAQTYWQLLLFRSLGGFGSAMFTVSSLGLMIRISPPDARGRVAGLFSSAFLVGSVGGPVLGSLTAGLGLAAPFAIYGVALLVAAAVVFLNLRHSALAAPAEDDRSAGDAADCVAQQGVFVGAVLQFRDGMVGVRPAHRAGAAVRHRGAASRTARRGSRAGDVRGRQRGRGHPQRLSLGPHRPPARC